MAKGPTVSRVKLNSSSQKFEMNSQPDSCFFDEFGASHVKVIRTTKNAATWRLPVHGGMFRVIKLI